MNWLKRWLGVKDGPPVVVVLPQQQMLTLTPERLAEMRKRWQAALQGRGNSEQVQTVLELLTLRSVQKQAEVQAAGMQDRPGTLNYLAGYAAGLGDVSQELLELLEGRREE